MNLWWRDEAARRGSNFDRRQFLQSSGLAGAILLGGGRRQPTSRNQQKFRIGMAATEWLAPSPSTATYWKACYAIASIGMGAMEPDNSAAQLDSAYGSRIHEFRSRSIEIGACPTGVYQALSLHIPARLPEMRSKISAVSGFLKAVGAQYLNLGWDVHGASHGQPYRRTPEDVKNAIHAMDELGRLSSEEHGIPMAYHAERDTRKEIVRQVLDGTNPDYVHWCADVGHLTAMGFDAVAVVKAYYSRLIVSHWKDFDPDLPTPKYLGGEGRGDFVELGKGVVDFPVLAAFLLANGYDGWAMIELDRTREPSVLTSAWEMERYVTEDLRLRVYPTHHRPLTA